jgi:hypothetical protein
MVNIPGIHGSRFEKEPDPIVREDDYGILSAKLLADRVIELATLVKTGMKAIEQEER